MDTSWCRQATGSENITTSSQWEDNRFGNRESGKALGQKSGAVELDLNTTLPGEN